MFKGLGRSLAIVTFFLVGVPAVLLASAEGGEWLEKVSKMTPLF